MRVRALVALAIAAAFAVAAAAPASAQEGGKKVLRMGWAQEPQTLNPFIDQDEEDFRVWSLNYDLLVDFGLKDLGPVPGIAESWDISPDKKTVTYKLFEGHKWSDGQPITSKDVKYSLETFAPNSLLFPSYVENVTSIETPDDLTVVIKTKQPDARVVGGLFAYILPEHIWGKQSVKKLTTTYKPTPPIVGSGPYVVSEWDRGRIIRMTRNPNFRGEKPKFDEIQWIKYGNTDAVDRALTLGEIDVVPEVAEASFARLEKAKNVKACQFRLAVVHAARVQPLQQEELPGREVQPGGSGRHRAPGDRLRDRSQAHQPDRLARDRVRGSRAAARSTTRRSTSSRPTTTRSTSTRPSRCSTTRAGSPARAACARRAASGCRSTCSCARSRS